MPTALTGRLRVVLPALLLVAAVHPGASGGGAVVADGQVVTARAVHGDLPWDVAARRGAQPRSQEHRGPVEDVVGLFDDDPGDSSTDESTDSGEAHSREPDPVTGDPWTRDPSGVADVVDTTGTLYFRVDGEAFRCSGAVVPSDVGNVVVTAGHCVHEGPGGDFVQDLVFVPAANGDRAPWGIWQARRLVTTAQWVGGDQHGRPDYSHDVGFVVLEDGGDAHGPIERVVGAMPIAFNRPSDARVHAFGYPAEGRFEGSRLVYCAGKTHRDRRGTSDSGVGCEMTAGASGGPWLADFDESRGTGTIVSVNSFTYREGPRAMYGPDLGESEAQAYGVAVDWGRA